MPTLSLHQLRTRHVGPIDLDIAAGECVCIRGASGSGKSLLLRAIADLDPHAGAAVLDGRACASMPGPAWRRQVALVMAEGQWWADSVGEHFPGGCTPAWLDRLGLPADALGWQVARCSTGERQRLALLRTLMPAQPRDRFNLSVLALLDLSQRKTDATTAHEALRLVDAWELRDRPVLNLSAGERQRVGLAQALVQGASVLLLDEPVAFQDPGHQTLVGTVLENLPDRGVVFCAHDVNWVARFATHVLGLGAQHSAPGWTFGLCEQALQPDHLRSLYGCEWTELRHADGHRAWMAV